MEETRRGVNLLAQEAEPLSWGRGSVVMEMKGLRRLLRCHSLPAEEGQSSGAPRVT